MILQALIRVGMILEVSNPVVMRMEVMRKQPSRPHRMSGMVAQGQQIFPVTLALTHLPMQPVVIPPLHPAKQPSSRPQLASYGEACAQSVQDSTVLALVRDGHLAK